MFRTACLSVVLIAIAFGARAQDGFASYVEVDAEHSVYVQPNFVAFQVEFYFGPETERETPDEDSAVKMTGIVDEQQKAFRQALNVLEIRPIEVEFSTPSVRSAKPVAVVAGAKVKFSLAGFANPDTGPAQFAGLCDQLAGLAAKSKAEIAGPEFGVDDEESVVRSAVTLAMTNAYPIGDALALAMSARVESVETVKVLETVWSKQPPVDKVLKGTGDPLEPNLRQISCTAKVHVTYAVRTAAP